MHDEDRPAIISLIIIYGGLASFLYFISVAIR